MPSLAPSHEFLSLTMGLLKEGRDAHRRTSKQEQQTQRLPPAVVVNQQDRNRIPTAVQ